MQNYIEKNLKVLYSFLLILSLSVISFSQKNIEKEDDINLKSHFTQNDKQKLQFWLEEETLETNEVNDFLMEAAMVRDTVTYLNALAILQKKYFTVSFLDEFNQTLDEFDLTPYSSNPTSIFLTLYRSYYSLLLSLSLLILLGTISFYVWTNKQTFIYWSIIQTLLLFILLNVNLILPKPKNFIFDAQTDLMKEPNFLAKNCKEELKKGELLTLIHENEVWLKFKFKNKIYFVPRSQSPFLF